VRRTRVAIVALAIVAAVGIAGCGSTEATPAPSETMSAQSLPLQAKFTADGQVVMLEVARTPEQQDVGLMSRTDLAPDRGMLFPVLPAREMSFWMKGTLIPLDILFLRDGVVTKIDANVPPCVADTCTSYTSVAPVDQVIELRAGRAAELGIAVGDKLRVIPASA